MTGESIYGSQLWNLQGIKGFKILRSQTVGDWHQRLKEIRENIENLDLADVSRKHKRFTQGHIAYGFPTMTQDIVSW